MRPRQRSSVRPSALLVVVSFIVISACSATGGTVGGGSAPADRSVASPLELPSESLATSSSPAAPGAMSTSVVDPQARTALDSLLRPVVTDYMEKNGIPGLIVSVSTPKLGRWDVALGVSDVEGDAPMDFADHVRAGSITKTMTGTLVLQLADQGKIDLDDQLSEYVTGVDTNRATVRQALQLISGIPDYTTLPFLNGLGNDPAGCGRRPNSLG